MKSKNESFKKLEDILNSNENIQIPDTSKKLMSGMLYWFLEQENKILKEIVIIFHINPLFKEDLERMEIKYEKEGNLNYFVIIDKKIIGKMNFILPTNMQKAAIDFEWLIEKDELLKITKETNGKNDT